MFLQSDVRDVTTEMRDEFENFGSEHFQLAPEHAELLNSAEGWSLEDESALDDPHTGIVGSWGEPAAFGGCAKKTDSNDEEESPTASALKWAAAGFLPENPFGVPTEREFQTLKQGDPVYRVMLVRR